MTTRHVIIGAGPAAMQALETIRQFDQGQSHIILISDEPAHARMALPYWLAGGITRDHTLTADADYFRQLSVTTRIGLRVERIDPANRRLWLDGGEAIEFDNLLIATGSTPIPAPIIGADLPGVQPLWTLAQTEQLLEATIGSARPRVALIGGGFIGFITLNAMLKRGWRLSVIERAGQVLPAMLDAAAAALVQRWLSKHNVRTLVGAAVQRIEWDGATKRIVLSDKAYLATDLAILATGVRPNLACLQDSGIAADNGILVNDRMQTNFPFIYAAGNVAQGPALFHAEPKVHAIQPTAVDHGRVAGANMAGKTVHYPGSLNMNILEIKGLQCASYGNWAAPAAESMTIADGYSYRCLYWHEDQLIGATFIGPANDLGMLTDLGMIKGILQTRTRLGEWKAFLRDHPFDIRRPYVATRVAERLTQTMLLGQPSPSPRYHHGGIKPVAVPGPGHATYMNR